MKILTASMSSLSYMLISFVLLGCNNDTTIKTETSTEQLLSREKQLLSDAISNHDYRLYGFAGRRVVLPGFESENFAEIKKRCGVRFLSGTGDVLKNNQDKDKRRLNYQFALKINKYIYALCLKNTTK